jgi:thioredoxin 1
MRTSLLLFTGEWCHTCKQVAPVLKQIALEFADKIDFKTVDIAQEPDLAAKYEVMSIPTIIILKNGQVADKINGFISKDNLTKKLEIK